MPFELPFADPITAIIDVRHGGDSTVTALIDTLSGADGPALQGLAVYRGARDDKVLTYGQWANSADAELWLADNATDFRAGDDGNRWSSRTYRLDSSANRGVLDLAGDDAAIAHTGLFAMLAEDSLAEFLEKAAAAAKIAIDHTAALLTANFHASLDGMRAVNLGFWSEEEAFWELARNPPFQNTYWEGLADNEPGFYRRVWLAE